MHTCIKPMQRENEFIVVMMMMYYQCFSPVSAPQVKILKFSTLFEAL